MRFAGSRHLSKWRLHENVSRSFSMPKLKPIVATTPEELAGALGLSSAAAKEWQGENAPPQPLKEKRTPAGDHSRGDREARRHCANQSDCDSERRSRTRVE